MSDMRNMYGQSQYTSGISSDPTMQMSNSMDGYMQDDNMQVDGINPAQLEHMNRPGVQSQTLDQIINSNKAMLRRRRTSNFGQPSQNYPSNNLQQPDRRGSLMEFSSSPNGALADFQFDPSPNHVNLPPATSSMMPSQRMSQNTGMSRSGDDLITDASFPAQLANFDANSINPYAGMVGYPPHGLDLRTDLDGMNPNMSGLSMAGNSMTQNNMTTSPMSTHFKHPNYDPGGQMSPVRGGQMQMGHEQRHSLPGRFPLPAKSQINQLRRSNNAHTPASLSTQNSHGSGDNMPSPAQHQSRRPSQDMQSQMYNMNNNNNNSNNNNNNNNDMQMLAQQMQQMPPQDTVSRYTNAYSTTGFDMLAILMRVATRQNPRINIGPVDLSCAFVVCDAQKHDMPIVYCSDMFERLTGYSRHEILHRNCRFLQAPDGKVQSGIKRKYVDDKSVLYLKNQINKRAEAQLSLINYRKGGQPFMNLLTMIPISWDTEEYKYYVGFQVDLVEQPGSVSARNPDGTYEINYNRSALPAYRLPAPDTTSALENMGGATISRDDVSQVLATIGNGETELSRRIWDKVLLENSDDVIHVLSLKGLFLYLSPACKSVLEYEPNELVGTPLSSVCHPSDIVPVTRELKDASSGAPVNIVYRIRRKKNGYTWFEAHGCLHTEQGKGRKCIILVGRQRPVYTLNKHEIAANENVGDAEMWSKMSTTGCFLYVSSTSRAMLDRLPDDLIGTSMQSLMRADSKKEFGRVLELARMGEKSTFKHDMQNRRGQVLQAQTTIYPGDAKKGLKPTFLLAQTRLLKLTRAMLLNQKNVTSPRGAGSTDGGESATPQVTSVAQHAPQQDMVSMSDQPGRSFPGSSGVLTQAGSGGVPLGAQDEALASEDNIFDELKTTRSTSWQFELRQMERNNRLLSEDLQALITRKKKRKKRIRMNPEKDCVNCHTRSTPEWRRGPSGNRDLCNSCGLRWAKQNGRVSPRRSAGERASVSPMVQQGNSSQHKDIGSEIKQENANREKSEYKDLDRTPKQERDDNAGPVPPTIQEERESSQDDTMPT